MKLDDLHYGNLQTLLGSYLKKGRPESRAFLNWVLEFIIGLDETTADDIICDDYNDKGIDAIYVDTVKEEILYFQSKLVQNPKKTVGDVALKEFVGSLVQFEDRESVERILQGNANPQLKRLISDSRIQVYLEDGFVTKGIFVTNAERDNNTDQYIAHEPKVELFDSREIVANYIDSGPTAAIEEETELDCFGIDPLVYSASGVASILVFPALASDLVNFKGIENGSLFSQNVRLDLGKTKVNKDIEKTISDSSEHANFPLFHNGITILCRSAFVKDGKIKIEGYTVVNGAQTLNALYRKRSLLTSDLRILTKLVLMPADGDELAGKITLYSNNQNAIKARDLKANSHIQTRLQTEFSTIEGGKYGLEIKRGDTPSSEIVISNELAGRWLLAFDLQQPWSCHQSYKVFDEFYGDIFGRPLVTAKRIILLYKIVGQVELSLDGIENKTFAYYSLTKFFILYLISEMLKKDSIGIEIYKDHNIVFHSGKGLEKMENIVKEFLKDAIIDLDYEAKSQGENFDYKTILKSPQGVKELSDKVMKEYEKSVARGKISSFGNLWNKS